MNFELADKLSALLKVNELDEAISLTEKELSSIPATDFHRILGKNLLHQSKTLAKHIAQFHQYATDRLNLKSKFRFFGKWTQQKPAAYYCEMNGFTINYDEWYIDLFCYKQFSRNNWDWISDFYDSTPKSLTITGFEDIQRAFEDVHENGRFDEPDILPAYEVCELLVILRLQELFREVYRTHNDAWTKVPMFVTAHDYEVIYSANVN